MSRASFVPEYLVSDLYDIKDVIFKRSKVRYKWRILIIEVGFSGRVMGRLFCKHQLDLKSRIGIRHIMVLGKSSGI